MSADRLTPTSLAAAVQQILAGAVLTTVAAATRVDAAELTDAADAYHSAGLAALHHRAEGQWYDVRVQFSDWHRAEHLAADRLGPTLDQLQHDGAISGWWFLRKYPCWRLRFADPDIEAVNRALDEFTATDASSRWWPTIYEPETYAFGGPAAIQAVHGLFCADSRGVLQHLRQPAPTYGRRELSLLLIGAFLDAAELDHFERGDVFAQVAAMRPAPAIDPPRLDVLIGNVRGLLAVGSDPDNSLFGPDGTAPGAAPWHRAYADTGRELAAAAHAGQLHRGLRRIASHIVIFHWNRLGLPATTQAALAHAAREAILPRS
ncbi:thiopeptide-type bacteriocin biosynthesis protein [Hamadaea tsunoensis]|uniref:thiopeptide-type bacteriocin biosynthesis protein n=1 Tax=Hamadaea tsunoensis TaxID=53368 RepID=UPI00042A199B|nr:thiopeptide-type bacteriocin biosynthesis protein [Hamadaea tsunoensis]